MRRAISNATPLIYLAKVGRLDLLNKLYDIVLIPEEVRREVVDKGKELGRADALAVEGAIKDGWLKPKETVPIELPIELHSGEVAVLSLATKMGIETVLIDEPSGRAAAKLLGLKPRGTLFVLLKSLESRELDLDGFLAFLASLINIGFRLSEDVYIEAVRKARELTERSGSSNVQ